MLTLNIGSMSQLRQPFMKILQINLRRKLIYWRVQQIMGCIGKLLSDTGNRIDTDKIHSALYCWQGPTTNKYQPKSKPYWGPLVEIYLT